MNIQPRGEKGFVSRSIGSPPRTATLRSLVTSTDRILQRVQLVDTAYREAIAGGASGARWATWLAQISGEMSQISVNVMATDSPMFLAIAGMREALGLGQLGAPAIDAESTLVPEPSDTGTGAPP